MRPIPCLLVLLTAVGCGGGAQDPVESMKPLAKAMHSYHEAHNRFPDQSSVLKEGGGKFSWRVAILPFIGEHELFREFNLDEPWDSSHNLDVAKKMPTVYSVLPGAGNGQTTIAMFSGPRMISGKANSANLRNIPDGSSNTLMMGYLKRPVPWTKPNDPEAAPDSLPTIFDLTLPVATADTTIWTIDPNKLDTKATAALLSINGAEHVSIQAYIRQ